MANTTLVLDVGNVLIATYPGRQYESLATLSGLSHSEVESRIDDAGLSTKLELGSLTAEEFVDQVTDCLELADEVPPEIAASWNAILGRLNDGMVAVARQFAERGRLALASNTNAIHWASTEPLLAQSGLSVPAILSFHVGSLKPEPYFFECVIAECDRTETELVFVDDDQRNVAGARRCGIQGWAHTSTTISMRRMTALLDSA